MSEKRPVRGFEGIYEADDDGNFFRVAPGPHTHVGRKVKITVANNGYGLVQFYKNNVRTIMSAHRATLDAFDDNPLNLPQINHINGIKLDNRLCNLERCDSSHNMKHAYRVLGRQRSENSGMPQRPVKGVHLKSGVMIWMPSMSHAARFVRGAPENIWKVCNGESKHCKGWYFEYLNHAGDYHGVQKEWQEAR